MERQEEVLEQFRLLRGLPGARVAPNGQDVPVNVVDPALNAPMPAR